MVDESQFVERAITHYSTSLVSVSGAMFWSKKIADGAALAIVVDTGGVGHNPLI